MKLSKQKRDLNLAEKGVWITNAFGDIDLLIAAADNKQYTSMLRELMKPYQHSYKQMEDDFFLDLQNIAISKTVLLGWRNMEAEESTPENKVEIEYSPDKAYEILSDPENVEFRKQVLLLAEEEEVFRKKSVEEITFQA